jgi:hypothetical protein
MSDERLRLTWATGSARDLSGSRLVVGRDPTADIPFPHDSLLSRRHVRIERATDGWRAVDLSSTNGTFVNGVRIESSVRVRPGDRIQVGDQVLTVETVDRSIQVAQQPIDPDVPRPPKRTRLQTPHAKNLKVGDVVVGTNSCPSCGGDRECRECRGYGDVRGIADERRTCHGCVGTGRCDKCEPHTQVLQRFYDYLVQRELGAAEAALRTGMVDVADSDQLGRAGSQTGGAIAGAVIGTVLLPGLGTLVGGYIGSVLGEDHGNQTAPNRVLWRHADLLYSAGVVYVLQGRREEAREAWIQALASMPSHGAARKALQQVD